MAKQKRSEMEVTSAHVLTLMNTILRCGNSTYPHLQVEYFNETYKGRSGLLITIYLQIDQM